MEQYWKIVSLILITLILGLMVSKQGKDFSILLTIIAVAIVLIAAFTYIKPIFDFISQIIKIGKFNTELITILLKSVGVGVVAEFINHICIDSGQSALGKTAQLFFGVVILWLSLPIFAKLLDLFDNILGAI